MQPTHDKEEIMKEEKAETGKVADDATYGGFIVCPRCGFDTRVKLGPVNEEDKKEYIRCLLGGTPFSKQYTMFDGQMLIQFKDLTIEESDKLTTLIHDCLQDPLFLIKGTQIKVLFSIQTIRKGDAVIQVDRERLLALKDSAAALEMYKEVFKGYPDGITSMVTTLFNLFSQQLFQIVNGAVDRNF